MKVIDRKPNRTFVYNVNISDTKLCPVDRYGVTFKDITVEGIELELIPTEDKIVIDEPRIEDRQVIRIAERIESVSGLKVDYEVLVITDLANYKDIGFIEKKTKEINKSYVEEPITYDKESEAFVFKTSDTDVLHEKIKKIKTFFEVYSVKTIVYIDDQTFS